MYHKTFFLFYIVLVGGQGAVCPVFLCVLMVLLDSVVILTSVHLGPVVLSYQEH